MSKNIDLVFQEVSIQDVVNHILDEAVDGSLCNSTGRTFANIESAGRIYSVGIIASCNEDDLVFNPTLPIVDIDKLRNGKGVIKAPENWLESSKSLKNEDLEFPEIDEDGDLCPW